MVKKLFIFMLLIANLGYAKKSIPAFPILPPLEDGVSSPEIPQLPSEDLVENGGVRPLEQNTTVMLDMKLDVFVPLEIVSDVDIQALVIDNQKLEVPFDVELNKVPEKKDYYSLKFSETEIDIDNDGQIDTTIYTPKFINTRIVEDNILYIDGEKISREGTHQRKVYMTIQVQG